MPIQSNAVSAPNAFDTFTFSLAVGTPATVGANKTVALIATTSGTLIKTYINAKTGPTVTALICDINKNGTTIFTTQANRIQIAAGQTSGTQSTIEVNKFVEGDLFTIDIDQVGTIAGQDITVEVKYRQG